MMANDADPSIATDTGSFTCHDIFAAGYMYYDNDCTESARPPHPQQRPIVNTHGEEIEQFQV